MVVDAAAEVMVAVVVWDLVGGVGVDATFAVVVDEYFPYEFSQWERVLQSERSVPLQQKMDRAD